MFWLLYAYFFILHSKVYSAFCVFSGCWMILLVFFIDPDKIYSWSCGPHLFYDYRLVDWSWDGVGVGVGVDAAQKQKNKDDLKNVKSMAKYGKPGDGEP